MDGRSGRTHRKRYGSPVSRCRTAFLGRLFWRFLDGLERPSYKERRLLHPETEEPVLLMRLQPREPAEEIGIQLLPRTGRKQLRNGRRPSGIGSDAGPARPVTGFEQVVIL